MSTRGVAGVEVLVESKRRFLEFLERRTRSRADAEDVLQSALVKVVAGIGALRHGDRLVPWFYRILRSTLADHHRRRAARTRLAAQVAAAAAVRRLRVSTSLFRRFPFNPPGYRMEDLPARGAVAFNVYRCPVADYFHAQGRSDLCLATWCALDKPLAEMWGGSLERQGTLAGGAARCDFRWRPQGPDRRME